MDLSQQKEQFSRAYVQAVAAVAGFAWSAPSVDDDSVDLTLSDRGGGGTIKSPKLDLQLKCHALATPNEPAFSYALKLKNFDDLRDESVMVPRILVVVLVPDRIHDWVYHTESELALRRCGYWASLRGHVASTNSANVTVSIDRSWAFHPAGLIQMMHRIGSGGLP
jgi:hypothetical protein